LLINLRKIIYSVVTDDESWDSRVNDYQPEDSKKNPHDAERVPPSSDTADPRNYDAEKYLDCGEVYIALVDDSGQDIRVEAVAKYELTPRADIHGVEFYAENPRILNDAVDHFDYPPLYDSDARRLEDADAMVLENEFKESRRILGE
jgi:hypothetical protein